MCSWCQLESFLKLFEYTLHSVLLEKPELIRKWLNRAGHYDAIITGPEYICAIAKETSFQINRISSINFNGIICGN